MPFGLHEVQVPRFLDNWHMKVVKLSALGTGHLYSQEILKVLISVKGSVDPRAIVWPEGISQRKITMTTLGIKPTTLWLVAQCLKQSVLRRHRWENDIKMRPGRAGCKCVNWINFTQDTALWKLWSTMKRLFRIFQKKEELLDYLSGQWLLQTAPRSQWLWKFKTFSATATSTGNT